jgi:hypothetical protein
VAGNINRHKNFSAEHLGVFLQSALRQAISVSRVDLMISTARVRHAFRTFAAVVAVLTAWLPQSAAAEKKAPPGMKPMTVEQVVKSWPRLHPVQRLAVIDQLINVGDYPLAQKLLDRGGFPGNYEADAQALRAALLNAKGETHEAAKVAQGVVEAYPRHRRARIELGKAKFATDDDIAARENFELAVQGANNPQLETVIGRFIDAIDNRKRWNADVTFGVAGSTNISQGSDTRFIYLNGLPFLLDDESLGSEGAAFWTALNGAYVHPVASGLDFVSAASVSVRRVTEDRLNDSLVAVSLGPRWSFLTGSMPVQMGLYATGNYRWVSDEAYAGEWGARLALTARPEAPGFANISASVTHKNYSSDWLSDDLSYQDGINVSLSATYDRDLGNGVFAKALANFVVEDTETQHLDYTAWNVGAGLGYSPFAGVTVYAQGSYAELNYGADSPGFDYARFDRRWDGSLQVTMPAYALSGFVPSLQYTYTLNSSNVPFYDFDAHGVSFWVTRNY